MRIVYIAGPFTAPTAWEVEQNVRAAEEVGLFVAKAGAMPIIPHANTRFFTGLCTPEFWYAGTLELLRRSDGIMLLPNWRASVGATAEREEALQLGKAVWEFDRFDFQPDGARGYLYLKIFVTWVEERCEACDNKKDEHHELQDGDKTSLFCDTLGNNRYEP